MSSAELAPAKVNLTLHVIGQRNDGYHLLDSLVVFVEVGDQVSLSDNPGLTLTGPEAAGVGPDADNLVLRAAQLMGQAGAGLILEKRLPVSSGIGGGSSDAAATIRLLSRQTGKSSPRIPELLSLGADVPVCLSAQPARMQGIGEIVSLAPPIPPLWLVLVNPRVAVSTPAVFRALRRKKNTLMDPLPDWDDLDDFVSWLEMQRNDLESPASKLAPVIPKVLLALRAQSGCRLARMSGSGATCFGIFGSLDLAQVAAAELQHSHPDWWIRATALTAPDQFTRATT